MEETTVFLHKLHTAQTEIDYAIDLACEGKALYDQQYVPTASQSRTSVASKGVSEPPLFVSPTLDEIDFKLEQYRILAQATADTVPSNEQYVPTRARTTSHPHTPTQPHQCKPTNDD